MNGTPAIILVTILVVSLNGSTQRFATFRHSNDSGLVWVKYRADAPGHKDNSKREDDRPAARRAPIKPKIELAPKFIPRDSEDAKVKGQIDI
jgi:hypothetical protein